CRVRVPARGAARRHAAPPGSPLSFGHVSPPSTSSLSQKCAYDNLRARNLLLLSLVMMNDFLLGGDLRVHRLGFGAMRLALGGRIQDPVDGIAILRRAVEIGVNHIDSAASYGSGALHAHDMIRQALWPYPRRPGHRHEGRCDAGARRSRD